jgi:hypothetical protein
MILQKMNYSDLEKHMLRAIKILYARDSELLPRDASEWAVAHRLAVYLEQELPEWNVDCEYNRQGTGSDTKRNEKGKMSDPTSWFTTEANWICHTTF